MMVSRNIVFLENLTVKFPAERSFFGKPLRYVHAVSGVTLGLEKGKTLGLVGESGCGKSTLGKAVVQLVKPTSGRVFFQGEDIVGLTGNELRKKRRDMQVVFQDPFSSLNPRMTVAEILAEPFKIHRRGNAFHIQSEVRKLLELVGLPISSLSRYPHQFSGGQRQRIGIARAIALKPSLVIADEPVSALDVSIQSQILNLLSDLKDELGLTYLFIAHDLAVVEHISDMIAVMYLGRIVEYAAAETLYKNPLHPYTQALIASIPKPRVQGAKSIFNKSVVSGDVPSPMNPPPGCHFHPRCPIATDICRQTAPALEQKASSQTAQVVACHHA